MTSLCRWALSANTPGQSETERERQGGEVRRKDEAEASQKGGGGGGNTDGGRQWRREGLKVFRPKKKKAEERER